MACQIGHARGQSLGSAAAGDWATGNEVSITGWYSASGGWTHVFRPKKRSHAQKIAQAMRNACENNYIGYYQGRRNTAWSKAEAIAATAGWSPECLSQISSDCDTDCSALVHLCCQCAGIYIPKDSGNSMTTHDWSEPQLLPQTGAFYTITSSTYTQKGDYLRAGDILRSGGHTAIVVTDGNLAYELDEFQQENDLGSSDPAVSQITTNSTGKTASVRYPVIVESTVNPDVNQNLLNQFKLAYNSKYGMTFSWQHYNDRADNTSELANDYARLMINHIIKSGGHVTDDMFNEWATARLVKMINSGYNLPDAAALERTLRLYDSGTLSTSVKNYLSYYYFGNTAISYNMNNKDADEKAFYRAYNQKYYPQTAEADMEKCPDELSKKWNSTEIKARPEYFTDVVIEVDGGYSIGTVEDDAVIPSALRFSDFDKSFFDGKLMSKLFAQFCREHPELLLWKKSSTLEYYAYVFEDENKNGQLQQDWNNMIASKAIAGKENVIDVYNFTKYKDFALNATVNKLSDLDQTVYLQNGILTIENRLPYVEDEDPLYGNCLEQLRKWDTEVAFNFYADDYEYYPDNHWAYAVDEAPYSLLFWLEFLDTDGELSSYSVPVIGPRQLAKTDNNVKAITYESVPNILFVYNSNSKDLQSKIDRLNAYNGDSTGYTYIYLPDRYKALFTVSSQGKTAKDAIDELLYNNTHAMLTSSITSIPIYYLEPNKRVGIYDDEIGINDEYILNKITIPLTYNGTMSMQVSKAVNRLY